MVRDEDNCTEREWTFCRSGQSAVGVMEMVVVGIEVMFEVGAELGKG